jgi:3'-5' exoribonuclease
MKKQFVRDLKVGGKVVSFFVAKYKMLEDFRDKTKGQFLTVVLADRTGQILARAWEQGPELYKQFEKDEIIAVRGRVEEYLERPQVIIEKLRRAKPGEYSPQDFVPQTEQPVDRLWATLQETIAGLTNPHLKALIESLFADPAFADGFRHAPASKALHHAYLGGLLEYVTEMIALAKTLLGLYPQLDGDLLLAGAILHDVGMVAGAKYEWEIDYTDEGRLLGHIVLGERRVAAAIQAIPDFPPELALRLQHLLLSHHGRYEWGAVREPQTLEAAALHYLAETASQVNRFQQIIEGQWDTSKGWTDYDRTLGRSLYIGKPLEAAEAEISAAASPPAAAPPSPVPPAERESSGNG